MRKPCLVLNEEFVQTGLIAKYKSQDYTLKYCGIGQFTLKLPITDKNLQFMKNGIWFYMDGRYLGYKTDMRIDTVNLEIVISGELIETLLKWAAFPTTQNFYGTRAAICEEMVTNNMISDTERKRELLKVVKNEISDNEKVRVQRTGDSISDAVIEILQEKEYGYRITPILRTDASSGNKAFTALEFQCYKGKDRSIENTEGNRPMVFTQRLLNLQGVDYKKSAKNEKNVLYVAGEGEEGERKVITIAESIGNSFYRKEAYIDARDLQSEKEDGTILTDAEYEELLRQRGAEKKSEYMVSESFSCKVAINKKGSVFGVDFDLGDYVQVKDDVSGITAKLQVTEAKRIVAETESLTITFGYKEANFIQKLRKKGVV